MDKPLEGRVALVTGGSRGIGRAITLALAAEGANVVIGYLRQRRPAEETVEEASRFGVKVVAVRANVGVPADVERLFKEVEDLFGRLDIFVSNAATGVIRPIVELDEQAWDWTMDANARGLLLGARAALPLMEPSGGRIIALSSQGSGRVLPGYAVVGASKAAIESLVRYLAVEFGEHDIAVNAISPGAVDTDALRHFPMREQILSDALARTPLRRLTTPEDVAALVSFLVSDRAQMMTGQVLVLDGGASLPA
jgi:enoyl-[acyl-carrier protein] reductase III